MAPMEPAKADDHNSKEALEKAFADQTADQLREVATRLSKNTEGMKDMLVELEAEKQTLREETEQLNNTISLMMQEMHKLNISGANTVEPQLEEGPLDFVGRFWEKVKPRDTAYQTSEHVGEIKKPVPGQEQPPPVQQVVQKASQEVVQKTQEIRAALGPLWARTQTFLNEKQNEIAGQVNAARAKQRQRAGTGDKKGARGGGYADGSTPPAAPEAAAAADPAAGTEAAASSAAGAAPVPEESAAASSSAAAEVAEPAAAAEKGEGEAAAEAAPAAAAAEDAAPASGEELISSTILIEARLKVDDGSVLTLHVCASDRCKEVAQRFVQENSLKAWFQEPLTAWLKKVEADAVKFPVKIEGDLMEIRKTYSKRK